MPPPAFDPCGSSCHGWLKDLGLRQGGSGRDFELLGGPVYGLAVNPNLGSHVKFSVTNLAPISVTILMTRFWPLLFI